MPVPGVDPAIQTILRLALGLLFLTSAWHKIRNFARFGSALANYRILPPRWVTASAAAFAAAEVCVGVSLLAPGATRIAALAAAALLGIYSGAIAVNLARGRREIDCGCAGPRVRRPLSAGLLARNAVLIFLAAVCALPLADRTFVWIDALTITASVASLALLYGAIEASLASGSPLRASRSRA
jgi:hypothetical protein